jgi:hypothetical protein
LAASVLGRKRFDGGNTPWRPPVLRVYPFAMAEEQFLNRPQSFAGQPWLNPDLTGIQIDWGEEAVKMIKIRRRRAGTVKTVWHVGSGPGWRQGGDAQVALDSWPQIILITMPGRRAT